MKAILSEKNIVAVLFVMVFIIFSLAQEDSRKIEKMYSGVATTASHILLVHQPGLKMPEIVKDVHPVRSAE
jgi:hypothetical protein